jgi:hypothetical protein
MYKTITFKPSSKPHLRVHIATTARSVSQRALLYPAEWQLRSI